MSYLDQEQLNKIWKVIGSPGCMEILKVICDNEPLKYNGIVVKSNKKSSLSAFYIRKLLKYGFLKRDGDEYLLTRVGVETINTIKQFEKHCTKFDLDDCDADGKVKTVVIRNGKYETLLDSGEKLVIQVKQK